MTSSGATEKVPTTAEALRIFPDQPGQGLVQGIGGVPELELRVQHRVSDAVRGHLGLQVVEGLAGLHGGVEHYVVLLREVLRDLLAGTQLVGEPRAEVDDGIGHEALPPDSIGAHHHPHRPCRARGDSGGGAGTYNPAGNAPQQRRSAHARAGAQRSRGRHPDHHPESPGEAQRGQRGAGEGGPGGVPRGGTAIRRPGWSCFAAPAAPSAPATTLDSHEEGRKAEEVRIAVDRIQAISREIVLGNKVVIGAIHGWAVGAGPGVGDQLRPRAVGRERPRLLPRTRMGGSSSPAE